MRSLAEKKFLVYTSFKDFSLNAYDDTNLFHLVSDSQRLTFSQELTPTLTLGLSLGLALGLAWGHFHDITFFIQTSFNDFSLDVFDDTDLLHLVSDSQHLLFSLELTPNLMLGSTPGQTISVENLKPNGKDEYRQRLLKKNLQNLFCRGNDPKVRPFPIAPIKS